jgi:CHAD domain-containing protein
MAFRLRRRPIASELQRLVRKELRAAMKRLKGDDVAEEDIHEARKSIKKVRAVVKLLRSPLGSWYAAENLQLREAGRRLALRRDADVMIETLEALRGRYSAVVSRRLVQSVARRLRQDRRDVRKRGGPAARQAAAMLNQVHDRLPRRLAKVGGWSSVRKGLVQAYARSRAAMKGLTPESSAAEFHEWRRRIKEHWYDIRLFEGQHPAPRGRARSLKTLESRLGDDHNLALLEQLLLEHADRFGRAQTIALVLGSIQKRQRALRGRALASGHRLFGAKPAKFDAAVGRWWRQK